MSDPLFQGTAIGPVALKNRLFMPAMHLNMCRDFKVTTQLLEFYQEHGGEVRELPADSVVLAVGTRSANPLEQEAMELGCPCRVVGDALAPATVFEANHQGYKAGRSLA